MHPKNYKDTVYHTYVSNFTQASLGGVSYEFSDSKLLPLLSPWVEHLDRDALCLDLGCGNGNVLHALGTLGFIHREGIDISEEQVALARQVCPEVLCGDIIEHMRGVSGGGYGLITLFDVIEHLPKPEILTLLGSIASALRPGGVFIAHCPNGDSPFSMTVFAGDFTHETLLNEASARHLCMIHGLKKFAAAEHLGTSRGMTGMIRKGAWQLVRAGIRAINRVETGTIGSSVLTRNFAFKAEKASP